MTTSNSAPEPTGARISVKQQVGVIDGGQVIGTSIGQMTVQRDAIIQTFQHIHERALTAEEAAKRAADLELELLAQGVRGLAQRLAAQATAAPAGGSPYKGLLAYGLGDADRFYGRAAATEALLDALRRGRLAVLHAESGAGKSSLLQAGIAARLIGAGRLAVYLRPYRANPTAAIKEAFMDLDRAPRLAGLPLREFLRYVTDILGSDETLYLLLDQFEEFYAYLDKPARDAFSAELGACLRDESLNVRWLIALRGEALSRLAEMETAGVEPFENEYRLARLTRDEAREAMTGPGFAFEAGLVETVLDGLTKNGEVAPPQLQLVCLALTEGLTPPAAIGREKYDRLGGAEGILRDYLVRQVGQFLVEEREPTRRLLRTLVTADGRRAVLAYGELVKEWETRDGDRSVLDTILTRLVERRLLVVQERPADGERTYELAHDTLLHEIQLDPAEQARKAVQEMLDRAVLDYRANPRVLLDDDKFDAIHARRNELVIGPEATELLRRSEAAVRRRRRLMRGGMVLVAGLAIIAAVLTSLIFGAQQELGQTQEKIKAAQVAATRIAATADAAEARAVAQQQIAEQQRRAALVRQLILRADSALATRKDPSLALLLAAQSVKLAQQYDSSAILDTDMALKRALLSAPRKLVYIPTKNDPQTQPAPPRITLDESGRYLVVVGPQPAVRVLDAKSGDLLWQADVAHDILATTVVSATSSLMAFLTDGEILRWDLSAGGEPKRVRAKLGASLEPGSIALSSTGAHLAVEDESDGQTVYLIDAVSGAHLSTYRSEALIEDLEFSPDASLLAFVGALPDDESSSRVHLVDVATRVETVMSVDGYAVQARFSPESNSLFVSLSPGGLSQINIQKRQIASIIPDATDFPPPIFSPDGRLLAYSTNSGTLILRNVTTGEVVDEFSYDLLDMPSPTPLAFHPDGDSLILSGGRFLNVSKRSVQDIAAIGGSVYWAQFTPDGRQVWLAGDASTLWLMNIIQGEPANGAVVLPNPSPAGRFALNDSGDRALTQDPDDRIRLWDLTAMQELSIPISTTAPADLKGAIAKWERGFMVLAGPAGIWLLDEAGSAVLHQFSDFHDTCNVAVSLDGARLLIVDRKAGVALWDLQSEKQIALLNTVPRLCFNSNIEFSSDSRYLAMSNYSSGAYLIDASDGRVIFSRPQRGPRKFGFTPDSQRAVLTLDTPSQAGDTKRANEILIVKPDTGELVASLPYPKPAAGVHHLALSHNVAAVSLGASPIYLIATATGEALGAIDARENVGDFWFGDPDTMLFLPAPDGLRIWDLGQPKRPQRVDLLGAQSASFAPLPGMLTLAENRSRYALSDLEMTEIRDMRDGSLLAVTSQIAASGETTVDTSFSSDLSKMATLTADGILRIWPTDLRALIHLACRTAGRDLSKAEWSRYIGDALEQRSTCQDFATTDQED
ncbi:MAG: NACHT and WD repeat domain-containing protein [Chloroflexi bacterium]|nr:NACHT and WD repeat domain-containing protein [Chloroflexota bacterium]